jgi:hypothetical protein
MIQRDWGRLETLEQKHWYGLHTSSRLTTYFRKKREPRGTDVTPEDVIDALRDTGVRCVIMGTHAVNTYRSEPRATQDVDILVPKRDLKKTVKRLHEVYPTLEINDTPVVTRFIDPATGKGVLDVMKPTQTVYQIVFRHSIPVADTHRVPDLEMTLASKFAAMVSPNRDADKKMIDGGDFINVIKYNRDDIDEGKLVRLADIVYPNGGAEIRQMLEDIDAGRTIQL